MEQVLFDSRIPIKLWLSEIEDGAMAQAKNLANLPFAFHHIAIMPDCHQGYGMPIGGVLATRGVIIPNCVGVDIGCGMTAVRTSLTSEELDTEAIKIIFGGSKEHQGGIRAAIPVGFSHHREAQVWEGFDRAPEIDIVQQELPSAERQLGTLGGGNHFIEIQRDNTGRIWAMLHSGSRNFGFKIAKEYNDRANKHCERWYSSVPYSGSDGLAFLPDDTEDAEEYWKAMGFALEFARANRMKMIYKIMDIMKGMMGKHRGIKVGFDDIINIHHNYAQREHHFGTNVTVHRKGATSAFDGEVGIIPGSQGTKSYIVRGKGNPQSFYSCSHGAGRVMGRKEARRQLNLEKEKEALDKKGIIHSLRHENDLDEAPSAYKDIDVVMDNQKDLVSIEYELTPLAVIKG